MAADTASAATDPQEEMSFEQILSRLERLVQELENGDTPLEKSLSTFEEGVRLARLAARRLDEAERRVEILLTDDNGVRTRPLNEEREDQ